MLEDSAMLKVKNNNGTLERFPALIFKPLHSSTETIDFPAIGSFFVHS